MITPDKLKVDDIVQFPQPLGEAYPGLWIVVSVGVEWCDAINGEGQTVHFGMGRTRAKMTEGAVVPLHWVRSASKLDKLLLFYDHFAKGLKE